MKYIKVCKYIYIICFCVCQGLLGNRKIDKKKLLYLTMLGWTTLKNVAPGKG